MDTPTSDGALEAYIENRLSMVNLVDTRDGKGEVIRDKKNRAGFGMNRGQLIEAAKKQFEAMTPEARAKWGSPAASPVGLPPPAVAPKPATQMVPAGSGGYKEVSVPSKPAPSTASVAAPAPAAPQRGLPVPSGSKYPAVFNSAPGAAAAPAVQPPLRPPATPRARPVRNVDANGTYTPPASVNMDPSRWTPEAIAQSQDRSNDPQYQAYRRAQTTNPYSGKPIRGLPVPPAPAASVAKPGAMPAASPAPMPVAMPAVPAATSPKVAGALPVPTRMPRGSVVPSSVAPIAKTGMVPKAPVLPTGPAQMTPAQQTGNQMVANTIRGRPLSGAPSLMPSMPKPNLAPPKKPLS